MRQNGRTMLETIAVLGIMGLLTVGAISMYSRSKNNLTRMKVFDEVVDIAENVKTLFQGKTSYSLLSLDYLQRYGAVKSTRNAYGRDIEVRSSFGGQAFQIIYHELSQDDCVYFGLSQWHGVKDILINGTSVINIETAKDLNCQTGTLNTLTIEYD